MTLILAALLTLNAQAADAKRPLSELFSATAPNGATCYGREYSTDHLDKHPRQTVKSFKAKLVRDDTSTDYSNRYIQAEVVLKGEKNFYKLYRAYLSCQGDTNECSIDCDGGRIKAWGTEKGLTIENLGFLMEGGCGEESAPVFLKPSKGGDDIFNLVKLPGEFCQL